MRKFWNRPDGLSEWLNAVYSRCCEKNAKFDTPLQDKELRGIAKSIAMWTWRHATPRGFSEWQSRNVNRRWAKESKKELGLKLLRDGMSTLEVSQELGVTQRTCQRWNKHKYFPKRFTLAQATMPYQIFSLYIDSYVITRNCRTRF